MHGNVKDLSGEIFGRLKVIKIDTIINHRVRWVCECECGSVVSILGTNLKSGDIVSCGCYKREINKRKTKEDFSGKRFDGFYVIKQVEDYVYPKSNGNMSQYLCMCNCGREFVTSSNRIEKIKSCGKCSRCDDISGNKYGMLVAIEIHHISKKDGAYWTCRCECGNIAIVLKSVLSSHKTKSCGCLKESFVARETKNYFLRNYNCETEYSPLRNNETGMPLSYDIYIYDNIFVEINGGQHYFFVPYFHKTIENFEHRKKLDRIKRKFARKNGTYIEVDLRKIKTPEKAIEYIENIISKI